MGEWDEIERRGSSELTTYKFKVLEESIEDIKDEVKESRKEVKEFMKDMIEMKVELKQLVGKSAATTSSWISLAISILSGVAIYFITGTKP